MINFGAGKWKPKHASGIVLYIKYINIYENCY